MTKDEVLDRLKSIASQIQDDDVEDAYQELVNLINRLQNEDV